jgi:hypothetical protein
MRGPFRPQRSAGGFALIAILTLLIAGALAFLVAIFGPEAMEAYRRHKTEAALAEAKAALLGFAMTYRDAHPGEVFGYLPCPDTNNDGEAELGCGTKDVTVVGRLPWKTLRIPDLRDGDGECLWYITSGHFKYNPKSDALNWDTTSRLQLQDADGRVISIAGQHGGTAAVIIAPGQPLVGQDRSPPATPFQPCGGNNTTGAYLESPPVNALAEIDGNAATNSIVTAATSTSLSGGTNNDRILAIRSAEVFDQVRKRTDFKADIDQALLTNISGCLNAVALPDPSGSKGIDAALAVCGATSTTAQLTLSQNIQNNWKSNLYYAKGSVSVNGESCNGVLAYSGTRTGTQRRVDGSDRDAIANYLEGGNELGSPYTGGTEFDPALPATDLFRCLKPSGPLTVSFDHDIGRFNAPAGNGLSIDPEGKPNHPSVQIEPSGGFRGGCLWYQNAIPLTGRVWRIYYRSQFLLSDPTGGADAGYGYTFQMVTTDPGVAPNTCGRTTNMGALGSSSQWGSTSVIFETDIHLDSASHNDPAGNHFAIMYNGNLVHSGTNGNASAACDGSLAGCILSPPDTFEESPAPLAHVQRIEIHTGCDSTCGTGRCNATAPLGSYVRLRAWADCSTPACTLLTSDMPTPPSVQSCITASGLDFGQAYFGFTGGFNQIDGVSQGVTLWDFNLRAE